LQESAFLWALKPSTFSNAHHLYIGKCKMYLYSLIGFRTHSILGPLTLPGAEISELQAY